MKIYNVLRSLLSACMLLFSFHAIVAQQALTIEQCYDLAKANYPLIKQIALLEKSENFNLESAIKGNFPQLSFAGQATYQSDVTSIKIPGVNTPTLSKDQYKIYGELYQPLTEFNNVKTYKELIKANTVIEKEKIAIELYKIKERINQIYFSILLIEAQLEQSLLLKKDIEANSKKIAAAVKNGTSTKMNGDLLLAESLKIDQRMVELQANRTAFVLMLAKFIHQNLADDIKLLMPTSATTESGINRPELRLFVAQQSALKVQEQQVKNRMLPKAGLFLQGGYGRPALNLLNNNFDTYYIGGLRFNWNLNSFYTAKNDKALLGQNAEIIAIQKENFLFNTQLLSAQQSTETKKYQDLISTDNEIIVLRSRIKNTASKQLENGIITPLDFITFLNAEDQAKQNLLLHQIQLIQAQYNLKTTLGN